MTFGDYFFTILSVLGVLYGLSAGTGEAEAQQAVMPPASTSQEPQPATQQANEAIILEQLTARRDWEAKAMSLQAWGQGLNKQVEELRTKAADSDKKLAQANAEIAELKGRAAPAPPNMTPMAPADKTAIPAPGNLPTSPKGLKPGAIWNNGGLISIIPDEPKQAPK